VHRVDTTEGQLSAAIATSVVQVLGEYTGRGPTRARANINRDSISVVLHDTLTKGERRLASDGHASNVLHTRSVFQALMRDDLVASVEDLTGRNVVAFMSANHIDPDMAVETFVLEPE
jgi:uncharacterized protein YbcI